MSRDATNEIRELRLALVCYGGVSLAVYMHGITKEIRKLVVASRAFDRDPGTNPFAAKKDATERAYFDALAALAAAGTHVRVVVDVISGTSAGGINGVCLATALARDGDDAVLRDLWLERGDIGGLLERAPPAVPVVARRVGRPAHGDEGAIAVHPAPGGRHGALAVRRALGDRGGARRRDRGAGRDDAPRA